MIKVSAIVLFILLGAYLLIGGSESSATGSENFASSDQFMPFGWWGVWVAVCISLLSFLGTEQIAVTAGEAKEPDIAVPKALKATVFRLSSFYVLTMAIMLISQGQKELFVLNRKERKALLCESGRPEDQE